MDKGKQEIIYSVKLDVSGTNESLNSFTQSTKGAKKAVDELKGSQDDNQEAMKRQEAAAKKTKEAIEAEAFSIAALRKENKQLTEIRNATTLSTEEGRKKVEQINKHLNENNKAIKDNVDQYTKQKIGVGDYTGALDKMVPGLGATIEGFKGMTSSALAFLATPIGMVIGALGLALGALTAYFKGSEEGQDKLAKAMAIGKVVMNGVLVVVEKLGGFLMTALEFIGDIGLAVVNKVSPQIGNVLNQAIKAGNEIADLQDKIESEENDFLVRRAETEKEIAQIREEALQLEGDAKRKRIQEAIDLEKSLSVAETEHNKDKLKLIDLEIKASGAATEEQKKQRAEALAAVINAEAAGYQATLRFQKEIEKLRDEAAKAEIDRQKKLFEASEVDRNARITSLEREMKVKNEAITLGSKVEADANKALAAELKILYAGRDKDFKSMTDSINKQIKDTTEAQKAQLEFERQFTNAKLGLTAQLGTTISALAGKNKQLAIAGVIIQKAAAIGQIIASTGIANAKAVASSPLTFGLPWVAINTASGALSVAATVAEGAKAVSQINQYYDGGYTGRGNPRAESRALGKKAYTYHMDEYVTPSRVLNTPEGLYYVNKLENLRSKGRNSFSSNGFAEGGFAQSFAMQQAFDNISLEQTNRLLMDLIDKPSQPVLVVESFEAKQNERNEVQVKANIA